MTAIPRASFLAGARQSLPLAVPVVPVGLVLGFIVNETDRVSGLAGVASAPLVLGGASQLAAISLLATGGGVVTTVATIAVINARHIMYSARLQSRFGHLPRWFRIVGPYFLLDQVFAITELDIAEQEIAEHDIAEEVDGQDDGHRMGHFLGAGVVMAGLWFFAVALGVMVGLVIPAEWSLEFTVPLLFLGLLVLSVNNRPGILAALVGGGVAVAVSGLPNNAGLLVGAVAGVAVGGTADWLVERRG